MTSYGLENTLISGGWMQPETGMIHMWQPPKGAAERRRRKKGQNLEQHLCEDKIVPFWASFHNSLCQSLQTRSG